jgi:tetratricopeptide (TPR) repeat protein
LLIGDHPLLALHQRHTMEEWRQAHVSGQHRPLPSVFPLPLQYLYNALLSPDPRQRPTAPETLARLQDIARRIQLTIYEPSDLVASTVENQGVYWMNWAIAYTRFDRYGEALERIEHAYALHPQDPDVILNRANVLLGLRRHEEGLVAFDAALAAVPSENHQQRKAILNNKGALFNRIERFAEAEAAYQNAIKEMPDAADTWRNRARNALDWSIAEAKAGVVASAHNLVRQAAAFARQTATLNPSMRRLSILLENVALAFNQFDLYQEAEDMFAFAVTFARESSTLFYNRAINALEWDEQVRAEGDAATAQARLQSALSYVQEAIRLAPQESDYARLAERIRSLLAQ